MRLILATLLALAGAVAQAADYYIDYAGGDDANNGTSTSTPWKHCPGMVPFTGSYSHAVGDRFIFKGGVTWPNAALPLLIDVGGAVGDPDFYGALDPSWYSGAEWSRAIFDGEETAFVNWTTGATAGGTNALGNVIWLDGSSADNVTIEGIEMKAFLWNDVAGTNDSDCWAVCAYSADNVTINNCYSHDWVVAVSNDGKHGGFTNGGTAANFIVTDCLVEGPQTIDAMYVTDANESEWRLTAGCAYRGALVTNSVGRYTTQGIWGGEAIGCLIEDSCNSYDSTTHENGAWMFNGVWHGNTFRRLGEGVTLYIIPGWSGNTVDALFYNNLAYDLGLAGSINPINVTNQDAVSDNDFYVYNNLLEHGAGFNLGTTKTGAAMNSLFLQNNIIINETATVYTEVDSEAADYPVNTISNNVVFTQAEADAAGLDELTNFRVLQPIASVRDQGVDLSATFTQDFNGRVRVAPFDIGPYEFFTFRNNQRLSTLLTQ